MLIDEIKKELSEITSEIENLSSEDEEMVKSKLAEFKKDILLIKFYIYDIKATLLIEKENIDNK
tara:strand:- start:1209 stop:1400 length:192 start_codon:yes stop_codon:yes gene_type:complete